MPFWKQDGTYRSIVIQKWVRQTKGMAYLVQQYLIAFLPWGKFIGGLKV